MDKKTKNIPTQKDHNTPSAAGASLLSLDRGQRVTRASDTAISPAGVKKAARPWRPVGPPRPVLRQPQPGDFLRRKFHPPPPPGCSSCYRVSGTPDLREGERFSAIPFHFTCVCCAGFCRTEVRFPADPLSDLFLIWCLLCCWYLLEGSLIWNHGV